MKQLKLLLALLLTAAASYAQPADEQQIRTILASQIIEWNNGHIDKYMAAGYWQSDSLLFIGKNGPTYGYEATLQRYLKSYPDKAHMGQLSFEILRLEKLSADHYFAVGKWALKRSAGDVSGSWTLLFRKIKGTWKIIADHSS